MRNYYELLEVNRNSTLKEVKKAYLRKIRKFNPEEYPKEFIEIRKAYEIILKSGNEEKNIKLDFNEVTEAIKSNNEDKFNKYIKLIYSKTNSSNFKVISDNLVDLILYCNKEKKEQISIQLIDAFEKKFEKLKLFRLSDKYKVLKEVINRRCEV